MTAKPITPNEVAGKKVEIFPDAAIEAFNELIAENYTDGAAEFKRVDVVARMVSKGLNQSEIYDKGWINVEDIYKKSGWKVVCDEPGWNESYDATYTFTKKR